MTLLMVDSDIPAPGALVIDVTVLFLEGGLASTAIAPMEIFRNAGVLWNQLHGEDAAPLFRVTTASPSGDPVAADGPVRLTPDRGLAQVRRCDLVVVPAMGLDVEDLVVRHADVVRWLRRRRQRGSAVAGICSGVGLVAEAGLLDGGPATTHWALVDRFRARYPAVDWQPERFVTERDGVYSAGGVYASVDLSLYLVERYAGRTVAMQCAKALLVERPRTWQSGFAVRAPGIGHVDERVREAQDRLAAGFRSRALRLEELAQQLGMSPRHFARRFKQATGEAPLAYLHRLRIDAAKERLEESSAGVQEIADEVGYEDVAFFRRLFKRYTGSSPAAYRRRFGHVPAPPGDAQRRSG